MQQLTPQSVPSLLKQLEDEKARAHGLNQQKRRINQELKARSGALKSHPVVNSDQMSLKDNLEKILPPHLVPSNVGHLNSVAWPFYYTVEFNWGEQFGAGGVNPVLTPNTQIISSFKVTEEAAFLWDSWSRHADDYTTAGALGPYQLQVEDRQSSRKFQNETPIPLQAIGQKSWPTVLPIPMLIMPNAFIDVTMSTFLQSGVSQNTQGNGFHAITFYGYRFRIEDADLVLSSIFQSL